MTRKFRPSPFALAVLTLLHEQPMHPYQMQRLIKERGKDLVINVAQRASLYQTINQLLRAGLITFWETARQERFPERTVYQLTETGRAAALDWMREMLSTPAREFPVFPAAISLLPLLTPEDALRQMETREIKLSDKKAVLDKELQTSGERIPRLFLLEAEYMRTMLETELNWVRSIIADLRGRRLAWTQDWMRPFDPPKTEA